MQDELWNCAEFCKALNCKRCRIEVLEDRLSKSVNRNKELLAEIQKIRAESAIKYKQLQLDYERLAGAYQKETEKKIIRL